MKFEMNTYITTWFFLNTTPSKKKLNKKIQILVQLYLLSNFTIIIIILNPTVGLRWKFTQSFLEYCFMLG